MGEKKYIQIKGAKVNNLQNIDVEIPLNRLIVLTGPSGSGKSSLAFDTLFAEGQRRYIESLSSYARQFLGKTNKPKIDFIQGVPPAIAIEQKANINNPRSTLATSTEIYEYLKLLFARLGKTYSPVSGKLVKRDTVTDVCDFVFSLQEDTKLILYAPFVIQKGRTLNEQFFTLLQQGFTRININGKIHTIEESLQEKIKKTDKIWLLIDRFIVKNTEENYARVADSVETAFFEGQGNCILEIISPEKEAEHYFFSNKFEKDGIVFRKPSPNMFSFNNPYGACPMCEGLGSVIGIDPNLVIPDRSLSVYENAVACWRSEKMSIFKDELIQNAYKFDFPIHRPIEKLTEKEYQLLWSGNAYFKGIDGFFRFVEENLYKIQYRVLLSRYKGKTVCPKCKGSRLAEDTQYVKVGGKNMLEILDMPVSESLFFFNKLSFDNEHDMHIAERLLKEIRTRMQLLEDLGLSYLTLGRASNTLSGGESQRVKITTILGSNLVGALYILDEPSIGLHSRDTQNLIKVLQRLRDIGNTVLVVEHDEDIILSADHVIDTGPLSGKNGGKIVFQGTVPQLLKDKNSVTAKYLSGKMKIEVPKQRRTAKKQILLSNVSMHNIKNLSVSFPLNVMTVVTGVSGSGKSTLIREILFPLLLRELNKENAGTSRDHLSGDLKALTHIEFVDQHPIGRSSRSNAITYMGAFEYIRQLFADQPLAKSRGYKPGFFSFNIEGGRCEVCKGEGHIKISMQFMPDVEILCDECKGKCYKEEVLDVKIEGKNIFDVLNFTIEQANDFFQTLPQTKLTSHILTTLQHLQEVGLGYLQLNQSSTTFSGGEAQRIKLAYFLEKGSKFGQTLFIFDEPTTGLHFHDIENLYKTFQALLDNGHTVLIIEHNLEIIKCADWIIELGPEAGNEGGQVVAQGTPESVVKNKKSRIAEFLKRKMK